MFQYHEILAKFQQSRIAAARSRTEAASSLTGPLRVSFKFQTLIRNALLFASYSAEKNTSLVFELAKARIRVTYKSGGGQLLIESPLLPSHQHLSDMRWHTLLFYM
ncbi:hypothetical protein ANCDUO_20020, partial [Ancylostoma duodenale]